MTATTSPRSTATAAPAGIRPPRALASAYFGIFAAAVVALLFVGLMLEHMQAVKVSTLQLAMLSPLLAAAAIGVAAWCRAPADFFAAGRSVTGVFAALGASAGLLGGSGLVALTGAFFFLGFDALPYLIGTLLGLLLAAVLVVPYMRKDGAYTLAGFLGRRFESKVLRVQAAIGLSFPALLLLIAELKIGGFLASRLLGVSLGMAVALVAALALVTIVAGGARSLTWSTVAQGLIVLLALMVPIVTVGILTTTLPVPQISYGRLAGDITLLEQASRMNVRTAQPMTLTLPGSAPETIVKPFFQPFGSMGKVGFTLLMLTVALGVASLPLMAQRATSAASVRQARRMSSWTLFFCAAILVTLPAIAAFARYLVLTDLPGLPAAELPPWLARVSDLDLARIDASAATLAASSVRFARDGVLLLLPVAGGLPEVLFALAALGALAAVLAAVATQLFTLAALWSDDVLFAWGEPGAHPAPRVLAARGFAVLTALVGVWLAISVQADPLTLFNWALAIGASTVFPLLIMSVWWKRINHWGAMAGMAAGNVTALIHITLTMAGVLPAVFGLNGTLSAALGVPIGALVAWGVSIATPKPEHRTVELLRDIRVPGGETVLDRDIRMAQKKPGL